MSGPGEQRAPDVAGRAAAVGQFARGPRGACSAVPTPGACGGLLPAPARGRRLEARRDGRDRSGAPSLDDLALAEIVDVLDELSVSLSRLTAGVTPAEIAVRAVRRRLQDESDRAYGEMRLRERPPA